MERVDKLRFDAQLRLCEEIIAGLKKMPKETREEVADVLATVLLGVTGVIGGLSRPLKLELVRSMSQGTQSMRRDSQSGRTGWAAPALVPVL